MNRLSELDDMLRDLKELCERGTTCTLAFVPTDGTWGKIILVEGRVISVRFQKLSGFDALGGLIDVGKMQYSVRVEEPAIHKNRPVNIDTATFFGFFQLPVPNLAPTVVLAEKPPAQRKDKPNLLRRKKVLLVDGDRVSRRSLAKLLTDADYLAVEAVNGFDALGQLRMERPDLMLLDLDLPDIDGYKALDSIKRVLTWKMPIFLVSGRSGLFDRVRGRLSDGDEFFTKPLSGAMLLEKIAAYLGAGFEMPPAAVNRVQGGARQPEYEPKRFTPGSFRIPSPNVLQSLVESHLALAVGPVGALILDKYRTTLRHIDNEQQLLEFVDKMRNELPTDEVFVQFRMGLLEELC